MGFHLLFNFPLCEECEKNYQILHYYDSRKYDPNFNPTNFILTKILKTIAAIVFLISCIFIYETPNIFFASFNLIFGGGFMGNCDLCNKSIAISAERFSAAQIKSAVQAGLLPPSNIDTLGGVFGMSQEKAHVGWIQRVMADSTDWAMCSSCASTVRKYLGI
jgi:hypothetical protein